MEVEVVWGMVFSKLMDIVVLFFGGDDIRFYKVIIVCWGKIKIKGNVMELMSFILFSIGVDV